MVWGNAKFNISLLLLIYKMKGCKIIVNIYYFFPTLRNIKLWKTIALQAKQDGFTHFAINPICSTSHGSGSLYAITDFFQYCDRVFPGMSKAEIDIFLKDFCDYCSSIYLNVMMDIILNHVSDRSPLIESDPHWFEFENGEAKKAFYYTGTHGESVTENFGDIVRVNHEANLSETILYFYEYVKHYLDLGFKSLRVDMACYLNQEFMSAIISKAKAEYPDVQFLGESIWDVPLYYYRKMREAGFDYAYNAIYWWNCTDETAIDRLNEISKVIPTVSIPESHDTSRLINFVGGDRIKFLNRLWITALMTSGFLMSSGCEYFNNNDINVFYTSEKHWQENEPNCRAEIRRLLSLVEKHSPLNQECQIDISQNTPDYILLKKTYRNETVKILINKTSEMIIANSLAMLPNEIMVIAQSEIHSSYPNNGKNVEVFKKSS